MITHRNIVRHELIGLNMEVIQSSDPTLKDLKGKIIDETKNMLVVEVKEKRIKVPKGICKFRFKLEESIVEVSGTAIVGRPQDRVKK